MVFSKVESVVFSGTFNRHGFNHTVSDCSSSLLDMHINTWKTLQDEYIFANSMHRIIWNVI